MKKTYSAAELRRRDFLKIVAKSGISSSIIKASSLTAGALLGRSAFAQSNKAKRILMMYVAGGSPSKHQGEELWLPNNNLTQFAQCSAPFEAHADECTFFSDTTVYMHGSPNGRHSGQGRAIGGYRKDSGFTYAGGERTLDYELGNALGSATPVPALRLGVQTDGVNSISVIEGNEQAVYEDNPASAFRKTFGAVAQVDDTASARKKSILQINSDALKAIKNKLGSFEVDRFDEHMEALAKLEKNLDAANNQPTPQACEGLAFDPNASDAEESFAQDAQLQAENMVLAFKCNLTNVGVVMLSEHQGAATIKYRGSPIAYHSGAQHNGAGDPTWPDAWIFYRRFMSEQVAYFLQRLKEETDEMGNPLLDSTIVVQTSDMGDGAAHEPFNAPFMLMGGGNSVRKKQIRKVDNHFRVLDTAVGALGLLGQVPAMHKDGPVTGIL